MNHRFLWCLAALWLLVVCPAVAGQEQKMSSFVRQLAARVAGQAGARAGGQSADGAKGEPALCAFVRVDRAGGADVLRQHGCQVLAQWGDVHIAMIPLSQIESLAAAPQVSRIEARQPHALLMDTTAIAVNAVPAHEGWQLPQAFTGRGVVVGVMDIGFDLTHPNFFSVDLRDYRIRRFWDQLALGASDMPVGADFTDEASIRAYAHSRDGLDQTHGTHTLGIAAGGGAGSPYRGMAFESDICLVSNATSEDIELVDSADLWRYTSAMDALGFKYIFDYAESVGQPCVISFSEGGPQGFSDDERLFYEVLDSLTGPGRILVAAAGNAGGSQYYVHKPRGRESAGTYLFNADPTAAFAASADGPFALRLVAYAEEPETLFVDTHQLFDEALQPRPDTLSLTLAGGITVTARGYRSFYNDRDLAVEVAVEGTAEWFGLKPEFSVELVGQDVEAELLLQEGYFTGGVNQGVTLDDADTSHSVHSPGAAPSVICVGATAYRPGFRNFNGTWHAFDQGDDGRRAEYSSVGPTIDGRTKPDVMAPGTNVVSSYSSYYYEQHPKASDIYSTVSFFDHDGRTYLWTSNAGTSMSTPVVAGAIALWLQAKPDLTPEQALQVIAHTARHYTDTLSYPNNFYGYGEIDVYAGLLEVLQLDAVVDGLSHHEPCGARVLLSQAGRLTVSSGRSLPPFALRVFDLGGRQVFAVQQPASAGTQVSIALPPLPAGVYAVQLDGPPELTGSTLIRIQK